MKLLILAGTDLNIQEENGWTALMVAAQKGHVECVKLLVQGGGDMNIRNKYGSTALLLARVEGHVDCVKLLIGEGADLNTWGENGTDWDSCFSKAGAEFVQSVRRTMPHVKKTKPQLNSKDTRGIILNAN